MKTRSAVPLPARPAKLIGLSVKPRVSRAAARIAKLPGFPVGRKVPEAYSRLILHMPGGAIVRGVWTGEKWWADGGQVFPQRWEPISHR